MHCPACQYANPAAAKFCLECGTRLVVRCAGCGTELPPSAKFCQECGQRMASPAAPATPAAAPPPAPIVPAHLVERILTSRSAIEGERKQVTVLFADLKGSMELIADRDPEDARRLQDPVLEQMMEAVHRYEGTVNQVMGDGIMALFGAPLAHEDHALRACYAALRLQETLAAHAENMRRSTGIPVLVRVGLNSGEVVVRSIGSDLKMDYSAVGQTVSLAARMEQMATPGSILLTPATLGLVEGSVQVQALGPLPVKGLPRPLEVYELVGALAGRTRFQAAAARGLTRFVGRDPELATLRRTLAQAGSGHGQVLALVGEPGVGKSRLVWEFAHSHRAQGWLVLETRSVSYGKATSYLPVIDLLKTWCGIEARDEPRRMREKLTGKLLTLDPVMQPALPALLSLLDLPVDDPAWQNLDPSQRRQRTLDALKHLLLREAREQPVLLVFEDLHWIDSETQALLDSLVESLPTARLLLLVNYRPEYQHTWASKTYYSQLRLDPLPAASADELLQALLGDDPALAPLKTTLIARTEGNPFFLEESVRTLVETRVLAGDPGSYRLTQPLERTQVPATVQAVLAARIDRLPPEDKRLLQSAAVIGKDVPLPLLRAIWDGSEADLHSGLARLQAAEFLYETALFPEPEYTFKHALAHEVAYRSLLQERRRVLHGLIVTAIETLRAERLVEYTEVLAHHALQGHVWEKAASYQHQAGDKAVLRAALREAVGYFERALAALAHLPPSYKSTEQAIDLRLALRNALFPLGAFDEILQHVRAAEQLAERLDDRPRLARIFSQLAHYYWFTGDHDQALAHGSRATEIATEVADFATVCEAMYRLAQAYYSQGDCAQSMNSLRWCIDALEDRREERLGQTMLPAMSARIWLAFCHADRGEFLEGITAANEALTIADAVDVPLDQIAACWGAGYVLVSQGELSKAILTLRRGLEIGQTAQMTLLFHWIAGLLGYAYALQNQSSEAVPLLAQAVQQADRMKFSADQALRIVWQGEAHLAAGDRHTAVALGHRALALARLQHERGHEARALRLLGESAAGVNPSNLLQAQGHFREGLVLAEELGMRPLQAHCHLGFGTLYGKVGRREDASRELTTAEEMYRAMEMTYWLAKAEAALTTLC